MANKFLKVMQDAATDRGLELVTGKTTPPLWASITRGQDDDRINVEVDFGNDGQGNEYWIANVYEGRFYTFEGQFTDNDTASLFRLLGTWLG